MPKKKIMRWLLGSILLFVVFQNCSPSTGTFNAQDSFQSIISNQSENSVPTSGPSPTPAPAPAPVPPPAPSVSPEEKLGCTLFVSATGNDTNTGKTKDLAFRTLQKASDASTYGDVVCVEPGTYTQFTVKPLSRYSTENNAILTALEQISISDTVGIGSYVSRTYPNHPRTRFVSVEKQKAVVKLITAPLTVQRNFTDIDGFEVDGSQATGSFNVGIMTSGCHIKILNNHVHHISVPQSLIDSGNGGAGIDSAGSGNYIGAEVEVAYNNVHDVWGPPGVKTNLIHGIYLAIPGVNVHHNTVSNIVSYCYHGWHQVQEEKIENNIGSNCLGIVVGSGDNPCTTDPRRCHTRDISIQNNQMTNTEHGILVEGRYFSYDYAAERVVLQGNTRDGKLCSDAGLASGTSERCPK